MEIKNRCNWCNLNNPIYVQYHDTEWCKQNFEDKYLDMLSQTGVKKYDELLKPFGLDAKQPDFWNMGLNLISDYIDELERLDKKIFG